MSARMILSAMLFSVSFGQAFAQLESTQTLLEKQMFYVSGGKLAQTKYWYIYLGTHQGKARRKFPGEDSVTLDATMSYRLMSSGYLQGTGMSSTGKKLDAVTGFFFVTQDTTFKIHTDSIAYVYDNFDKVVLSDGRQGYLRINNEGEVGVPSDMLLTSWKMVVEYGDKVLRKEGEAKVQALAFTKENAQKALAEQKKLGN